MLTILLVVGIFFMVSFIIARLCGLFVDRFFPPFEEERYIRRKYIRYNEYKS